MTKEIALNENLYAIWDEYVRESSKYHSVVFLQYLSYFWPSGFRGRSLIRSLNAIDGQYAHRLQEGIKNSAFTHQDIQLFMDVQMPSQTRIDARI